MVEINKNNILKPKSVRAYELSQKYSWEKHATQILALYSKFTSTSKDWNFYNSFELAAYRTLATMVSLFAEEKKDILSEICSGVFFKANDQGICMIGNKK